MKPRLTYITEDTPPHIKERCFICHSYAVAYLTADDFGPMSFCQDCIDLKSGAMLEESKEFGNELMEDLLVIQNKISTLLKFMIFLSEPKTMADLVDIVAETPMEPEPPTVDGEAMPA